MQLVSILLHIISLCSFLRFCLISPFSSSAVFSSLLIHCTGNLIVVGSPHNSFLLLRCSGLSLLLCCYFSVLVFQWLHLSLLCAYNSCLFDRISAMEKAECMWANYALWKFHIQFFVEGKGLWDHIDGFEQRPEESDFIKFKQWKIDNAKIISWILRSVDANIGTPNSWQLPKYGIT